MRKEIKNYVLSAFIDLYLDDIITTLEKLYGDHIRVSINYTRSEEDKNILFLNVSDTHQSLNKNVTLKFLRDVLKNVADVSIAEGFGATKTWVDLQGVVIKLKDEFIKEIEETAKSSTKKEPRKVDPNYDIPDEFEDSKRKVRDTKEIKVYTSDEHTGSREGFYYGYMTIQHPDLGEFKISVRITGRKSPTAVRIDGYPWKFLMEDSKYRLTREQQEWVINHKYKLFDIMKKDIPSTTIKDNFCMLTPAVVKRTKSKDSKPNWWYGKAFDVSKEKWIVIAKDISTEDEDQASEILEDNIDFPYSKFIFLGEFAKGTYKDVHVLRDSGEIPLKYGNYKKGDKIKNSKTGKIGTIIRNVDSYGSNDSIILVQFEGNSKPTRINITDYLQTQSPRYFIIKDSKKIRDAEEVGDINREALEEYLEWEGIIGYTNDIIDAYESECAFIDDEYKEFEDAYEALDAYLEWEGIIGYSDAIYDILECGKDSCYYEDMLEDKNNY